MSENNTPLNRQLFRDLENGIKIFEDNFPLTELQKNHFHQTPGITMLTCSDSRVPATLAGELFNRVFCVENIGNQVKTAEGSIFYGLLHLKTPLMLVVGHSDCGAIKAAAADFSSEPEPIKKELEIVKASLDEISSSFNFNSEENSAHRYMQLAELNVDIQIKYLINNYDVEAMVKTDQLLILGLMVDLHNLHGSGYGRTYLINVNGDHNSLQPEGFGVEGAVISFKRLSRY